MLFVLLGCLLFVLPVDCGVWLFVVCVAWLLAGCAAWSHVVCVVCLPLFVPWLPLLGGLLFVLGCLLLC
jgi:fatty acid desaturase